MLEKKTRLAWMMVAAMMSIAACSETSSEVARNDSNIIGGSATRGYEAVLFVLSGDGLCTGSLVSPHVLVTAKHCVAGKDQSTVRVATGVDFFRAQAYQKVLEIRQTDGPEIEGKDLALVLLEESGDIPPLSWEHKNRELMGEDIVIVGYGQQQLGNPGTGVFGRKALVASKINAVSDLEFAVDGPATCFGDSGGPAFSVDGTLLGVVSRGQKQCNGPSIFTRVDAFSTMIVSAIRDAGDEIDESFDTTLHSASLITSADSPTATSILIGRPTVGGGGQGCSVRAKTYSASSQWIWCVCLAVFIRRAARFFRSRRF